MKLKDLIDDKKLLAEDRSILGLSEDSKEIKKSITNTKNTDFINVCNTFLTKTTFLKSGGGQK